MAPILIGVIVLLVMLIAGVVGYIVLRKSPATSPTESDSVSSQSSVYDLARSLINASAVPPAAAAAAPPPPLPPLAPMMPAGAPAPIFVPSDPYGILDPSLQSLPQLVELREPDYARLLGDDSIPVQSQSLPLRSPPLQTSIERQAGQLPLPQTSIANELRRTEEEERQRKLQEQNTFTREKELVEARARRQQTLDTRNRAATQNQLDATREQSARIAGGVRVDPAWKAASLAGTTPMAGIRTVAYAPSSPYASDSVMPPSLSAQRTTVYMPSAPTPAPSAAPRWAAPAGAVSAGTPRIQPRPMDRWDYILARNPSKKKR